MAGNLAAAFFATSTSSILMAGFEGYNCEIVQRRLSKWPLFHPKLYLHLNSDLHRAEANASLHFASHGCWERREFTRQARLVADLLSLDSSITADFDEAPTIPPGMLWQADIGIYTNSGSNFFMRELGHLLAIGLRRLGLRITEGDEKVSPEDRRTHSIIVAPHEFFELGNGKAWARGDVMATSVMLSTEQPQTPWFTKSLPYLLSCQGVLDLCWQNSSAFAAAGLPSSFYMPGMSEAPLLTGECPIDLSQNGLIASLPQAALDFTATDGSLSIRPLDVTFMASASPIRDDFLGRHLSVLRDLQTVLIYRQPSHSVPKGYASDDHVTHVNNFILQRSKIMLNIHRDAMGYFEVHRIGLQGMWNGCAVVTNACLKHPYFVANEHYFEETLDRIPKLIEWLVATPEGRFEAERVRDAALVKYATSGNQRTQSLIVANFLARCFELPGLSQ